MLQKMPSLLYLHSNCIAGTLPTDQPRPLRVSPKPGNGTGENKHPETERVLRAEERGSSADGRGGMGMREGQRRQQGEWRGRRHLRRLP